jgi:hypothetical protein
MTNSRPGENYTTRRRHNLYSQLGTARVIKRSRYKGKYVCIQKFGGDISKESINLHTGQNNIKTNLGAKQYCLVQIIESLKGKTRKG